MNKLFSRLSQIKITEAKIANLVFTLTPWIAQMIKDQGFVDCPLCMAEIAGSA